MLGLAYEDWSASYHNGKYMTSMPNISHDKHMTTKPNISTKKHIITLAFI